MSQYDLKCVKTLRNGCMRQEDVEQKLSHHYMKSNDQSRIKQDDSKTLDSDVNVIDWKEAILYNSKGFSRLTRNCDDKSLNILLKPTLFSENSEKHHVVSTMNSLT